MALLPVLGKDCIDIVMSFSMGIQISSPGV